MADNFTGTWKNQRGSVLTLDVKNGIVTGTFDSGVGDNGEPLVVPVNGRVLRDVITFNVVYERFGTIATWVGQLVNEETGSPVLEASWLHISDISQNEEPQWAWSAVRTGADTFTK